MNELSITMLAMALRGLPARIHAKKTAELLGFALDDVTILLADPKLDLKPLGHPKQNAPKFFAAVDVLRLANDPDWLNKASNAVRRHHLKKRDRANGTSERLNSPSSKSSTKTSTNDGEQTMTVQ